MIEFIKHYSEELMMAIVISIIIEMFAPNNNIKKYIRIISSIYVIFVIINPIVSKINNFDIYNIMNNLDFYNDTLEVSNMDQFENINKNSDKINDLYILEIEDKIRNDFYQIKEIKVRISEDSNQIEKINIILKDNIDLDNNLKQMISEKYNIDIKNICIIQ